VAVKYSINEVVRFAIEMEKDGGEFYALLADRTDKPELKDFFLQLKGEEEQHQCFFEKLLAELDAGAEELANLENEYTAYLHAYIENSVFDKRAAEQVIAEIGDDLSLVEYAITKENETISYYKNLLPLVAEHSRNTIDKIISEENLHVMKLLDYKEKIA
jgi:rubrerythrin